jgi:hypothetical protein
MEDHHSHVVYSHNSPMLQHNKSASTDRVQPAVQENLTKTARKTSNIGTILVIIANLAFGTLLAVIAFIQINLTKSGTLTPSERTVYVTVIAIIGVVLSHFSVSRIRDLWLRKCDVLLSAALDLRNVDPLWQVTVGTASVADQFRQWRVTTTFLITGLLTTAIVAGFTSTASTVSQPTHYAIADDAGYVCVRAVPDNAAMPMWKLDNGSELSVPYYYEFCPQTLSLTLMGAINVVDPENYGYADFGVAVKRSALGAPASLYSSGLPSDLSFPADNHNIVSTSQCVPVMTKNPFQCKGNGNVEVSSDGYLIVASGTCNTSLAVPNNFSAGTSALLCTKGSVGQATIVLAASGGDAMYLSEAAGDAEFLHNYDLKQPSTDKILYTVVCDVDASDVVANRKLIFHLADITGTTGALARSLQTDPLSPGTDCNPQLSSSSATYPHANTDKLRGIIATSPAFLIYNKIPAAALGLFINTLSGPLDAADPDHRLYVRQPPFAFADSPNALSDVLGLSAALVLSRVTMTGYSNVVACEGSMEVAVSRVGTGNAWALVFALPPLAVAASLLWLMVTMVLGREGKDAPVRTRSLREVAALFQELS